MIPGVPCGMQFLSSLIISASMAASCCSLDSFDNDTASGPLPICLTFSAAQGWNEGFSSGVTLGSKAFKAGSPCDAADCTSVASSFPNAPTNQIQERSGCQ